jgi:hypothetical protein
MFRETTSIIIEKEMIVMKKQLCLVLCAAGLVLFAQNPAPADLKLCYEVLEASQFEKQLNDSSARMLNAQLQASPMLVQFRPELEAFYKKCLNYQTLKEEVAKVYCQMFTPEELRQLIAFYKSPTGRMFVQKSPELTVKITMMTQEIVTKNMPELIKAIQTKAQQLQQKK